MGGIMRLGVYLGALSAFAAASGLAFWWRRYKTQKPWHCDFCRENPLWLYRGYWICHDSRCLQQAEAEANWKDGNP